MCALLLTLSAPSAFAAAYKCVSLQGATSFASVPCPPGGGETTVVPPAQGNNAALAKPVSAPAHTLSIVQVRTVTHYQHVHFEIHRGRPPAPAPQNP